MDFRTGDPKPLYAGINNNPQNGGLFRPTKVFFFERNDGKVLIMEELQAWELYARRPQVVGTERPRFKLIGTGDGLIYQKALNDAREVGKAGDIPKAQEILRKGQEDELEACRGNIIKPRNMDRKDLRGNRTDL